MEKGLGKWKPKKLSSKLDLNPAYRARDQCSLVLGHSSLGIFYLGQCMLWIDLSQLTCLLPERG